MEEIGSFFIELFMEIIGELFFDTSIDLSKSKYVPKWLRIIAITLVIVIFGGLLLVVIWSVFGRGIVFYVSCAVLAAVWLFLTIRALTIKTKKYEYVSLDENLTFKGKRTYSGEIKGTLKLKEIHHIEKENLEDSSEIKVKFSRTGLFPEKEQIAIIEEQEIQLLNELYAMDENKLNGLVGRARNELMKKLGDRDNGYSNGKSMILKKVSFVKSPNEYMICYYFKDEKTGKKVKVKDTISF